jgi:hypothetical protein
MKLWFGYGSEHSANLVIIGQFEDAEAARKTQDLLNEATTISRADEDAGHLTRGSIQADFSKPLLDFVGRTNLAVFGYGDPEQLLYDYTVRREGDRLVITTEEYDTNAIMKILLHNGAKVEVYSAHDHGGPYGRPTNRG